MTNRIADDKSPSVPSHDSGATNVDFAAEQTRTFGRLEAALKFCEHRFSRLPGVSSVAAYGCDAQGRILLFNTEATKLWGREPIDESIRWCGSLRLFGLDGTPIPHTECYLAKTVREKRPVFGEDILVERSDGTRVRVSAQPEPVFDADGQFVGAVTVLLEIAEVQEVDRQLRLRSAMLDHVGQAVISTDVDGTIRYWNKAATRMYGWTDEEAIGRKVVDVVVPQMVRQQAEDIFETLARGEPWSGEFLVQHKLGHHFSAYVTNAPVVDAQNRLIGIIGVSLDLEPASRADRTLKEVEDRYETLFNTMSEGVALGEMIYDDDGRAFNYRCLDLNPAGEQCLGYPKQVLIGKTLRDFVKEPNQEVLAHFDQVVRTGEPTRFEFFSRELKKHLSVIAFRTGAGKFAGILQDVTESRRTMKALQDSEARFRGLFQAISGGVVVQKADGTITDANDAAAGILGLSTDQLRGLTSMDPRWHAIREDGTPYPGEEHPGMITLRTGKPITGAIMGVYNPTDAEYHWIVVNCQPVVAEDPSTPLSVVCNFVDITPLRRAEEALFESRAEFAAFMDNLPGFAWIKRFDGRYTFLNKVALSTLRPHQEWRGKLASELWRGEIADQFESTDNEVIESGSLMQAVQSGHDSKRNYLVTKFPIFGKNRDSSFICGIALDATEMQQTMEELRKNHRTLEHANKQLQAEISKISEEEQRRLGQDLHDDICQNLAAIALLSGELAARLVDSNQPDAGLAERIERMTCEALNDSRNLARGLHAITVESLGLGEALKELAERTSGKVTCLLELSDEIASLRGSLALGLYRIAQEAVSNSLKHSEARKIVIGLHRKDGQFVLNVTDNGRGTSKTGKDGMGIHIMDYRARLMGGTLQINSAECAGTEVICRVPETEDRASKEGL
jgi:PAS domain S-box-containing protein